MKLEERIVRLAVRALPARRREARLEEWLADLAGCRELGLGSWGVALGAVRCAAMSRNVREHLFEVRPRTWVAAGAAVLGVGAVALPSIAVAAYAAEQLRGVVTSEVQADGTEVTVHWRDYPAIAGVHPSCAAARPTLEEGLAAGVAVTTAIREELATALYLEWAEEAPDSGVIQPAQNGFGGISMLYVVNAPAWKTAVDPLTAEQIEEVADSIADAASLHGFTQITMEPLDPSLSGHFRAGTLSDRNGQWLSFSVGTVPGNPSPTITLMYGANALLPTADQAEFDQRIAPFLGYDPPPPLQS